MPSDDPMASLFRAPEAHVEAWHGDAVSDAALLDRFVEQWDQSAFRELVERHGPMVLGVCRRVVRDPHAADDAFQATFLVLARKAGSIRRRTSIGAWLYGVAQRVALEARSAAARRRPVHLDSEVAVASDLHTVERDELHTALHDELARLPEKYRAPLVLCYIEGLTHEAVARHLKWPIGTVRTRVARGRDLLRNRLIRRGLAPAVVLLALGLLPQTAVAVPPRLVDATVRAAARVAVGEHVPRRELPARVFDLERNVRNAMQLTQLKWAAVFALTAFAIGAGVAVVVPPVLAADDEAAKANAERTKLQGTWLCAGIELAGEKKAPKGDEEQITFVDDMFRVTHNGHVEEEGTIALNPSQNPKEIDLHFQGGKRDGKTEFAIYAWDGANLKLCWARDGDKHPTDFTTKPGDNHVVLILKRQDP